MEKTDRNRYKVVKQTWGRPCGHPSCDTLHRSRTRFNWVTVSTALDGRSHFHSWHEVTDTEWIIIDRVTDERAFDGDAYDTKHEAQYSLAMNLKWLRNEALRAAVV